MELSAYEPPTAFEKRKIVLLERVRCGDRNDYAWCEISPPLEGWKFGRRVPLGRVLLAPRFAGDTLFPDPTKPCHVYVAISSSGIDAGASIAPDDVKIIAWGLLDEGR